MNYTTAQIEAKADEIRIYNPMTSISYVGQYVCQGTTQYNHEMVAVFGDWSVELELQDNGTWFVMKAHNYMTGTEYNMPVTWFDNKMKK